MNIINKQKEGVDHYDVRDGEYYFGRPSKKEYVINPGIYTIGVNKGGEVLVSQD